MDEATKQVAYALHDIYGYHKDEEFKAKAIVEQLRRNGYHILSKWELDELENADRPQYSGW